MGQNAAKYNLSMFNEPNDIKSAINKTECTERAYLIDILMEYDIDNIDTYHYIAFWLKFDKKYHIFLV